MNVEYSRDLLSWRKATSCPVCGDGRIVPFATLRHIPHSRCRDCGLTFANPLPPDELLGDFYNSSYYANFRQFELDRARQDHYGRICITNTGGEQSRRAPHSIAQRTLFGAIP